jgi:hypothetical protein
MPFRQLRIEVHILYFFPAGCLVLLPRLQLLHTLEVRPTQENRYRIVFPHSFIQIRIYFSRSAFIFLDPHSFFQIRIHFSRSAFIFQIRIHFSRSAFIFQIRIHFSRSAFIFPDPHFFPDRRSFFQIRIYFFRSAFIFPDPHLFFQIRVQPETWFGVGFRG